MKNTKLQVKALKGWAAASLAALCLLAAPAEAQNAPPPAPVKASKSEDPRVLAERADFNAFDADVIKMNKAKNKGEPSDYSGFRARFDAHAAKYADLGAKVADHASAYLRARERSETGSSEPEWRHLAATTTIAAVRAKANEKVHVYDLLSKPLDIAFTAVDGRAVDLKSLRGKVVLVDFWATWCGPCLHELPNVKKAYAAYHDRGFEIVGISLEMVRDAHPNDTAEQAAAKLEAAKKILVDFTAKEGMPWPQYFDGKQWQNPLSKRYGVLGIPTMILLDQNGMVAGKNVPGESLEKEVKRLLKL